MSWDVRESGPADAEHTVLLLPGGMCTTIALEQVIAALGAYPLRVVAATLPGFGRTAPPDDVSMEHYAQSAGELAASVRADAVAGHSLGANVALEMVAAGAFGGPVVLLSPSFSREDEAKELGVMNAIGRVPGIGRLAWAAMIKAMPRAMRSKLPPEHADALAADLGNNDPRACRAIVRDYYRYLDRHGSVAPRLCAAGVPAVVAFGDDDEIGLTDAERGALEEAPGVTLVTIADATHFMVVEQPTEIARLVFEATQQVASPAG